jgi:hypothetical protein
MLTKITSEKIDASLKTYAMFPDDKFASVRRLLREGLTPEQYSYLINMRADMKQNGVAQTYAHFTLR